MATSRSTSRSTSDENGKRKGAALPTTENTMTRNKEVIITCDPLFIQTFESNT